MASFIRSLFGRRNINESVQGRDREIIIEDEGVPSRPYIISTLFYLLVIFFIGLPMWFLTCSVTRYSLPELDKLEDKLLHSDNSPPKVHLDISVIQLSKFDATKADEEASFNYFNDKQTNFLRAHLPKQLDTTVNNVTYNINWRVRRPTQDEHQIFSSHQAELFDGVGKDIRSALVDLEKNLVKIHRSSNKSRLFIYLIEETHYSAYCDPSKVHTFTISFERFVYLCPSSAIQTNSNYEQTVTLIENSLDEIYTRTVDIGRLKHILKGHSSLVLSLLPEEVTSNPLNSLSTLADNIHRIYDKNVKQVFPEMLELVNLRLNTQVVVELLDEKMLNSLLVKQTRKIDQQNSTVIEARIVQLEKVSQLFTTFGARLHKHSSQNVHNVLVIDPKLEEVPIVFKQDDLALLEHNDLNSMLLANDDKSIVLGMRSLIRRVVGLTDANICKHCFVRRDVFFNRWEFDALISALTLVKLQNTLLSLQSISKQSLGVKIPKEVSNLANEAYNNAMKSIEHLETKQIQESYRLASRAYELSESAYYDPTLLESLYFPDDLKYAIYLPLFLPLAFTLSSSIYDLLKHLSKQKPKLKIN